MYHYFTPEIPRDNNLNISLKCRPVGSWTHYRIINPYVRIKYDRLHKIIINSDKANRNLVSEAKHSSDRNYFLNFPFIDLSTFPTTWEDRWTTLFTTGAFPEKTQINRPYDSKRLYLLENPTSNSDLPWNDQYLPTHSYTLSEKVLYDFWLSLIHTTDHNWHLCDSSPGENCISSVIAWQKHALKRPKTEYLGRLFFHLPFADPTAIIKESLLADSIIPIEIYYHFFVTFDSRMVNEMWEHIVKPFTPKSNSNLVIYAPKGYFPLSIYHRFTQHYNIEIKTHEIK